MAQNHKIISALLEVAKAVVGLKLAVSYLAINQENESINKSLEESQEAITSALDKIQEAIDDK